MNSYYPNYYRLLFIAGLPLSYLEPHLILGRQEIKVLANCLEVSGTYLGSIDKLIVLINADQEFRHLVNNYKPIESLYIAYSSSGGVLQLEYSVGGEPVENYTVFDDNDSDNNWQRAVASEANFLTKHLGMELPEILAKDLNVYPAKLNH